MVKVVCHLKSKGGFYMEGFLYCSSCVSVSEIMVRFIDKQVMEKMEGNTGTVLKTADVSPYCYILTKVNSIKTTKIRHNLRRSGKNVCL